MRSFKLQRIIKAPIEKVWAAADFTKSAGPFPMEVENEGNPLLQGKGFQRALILGNRRVIERLEDINPPHSYTYTIVDGIPVKKGYLGKVEFMPKGDATQITWSGIFTPKFPGSGWLVALQAKKTAGRVVDAIEETSCRTV